MNIRTNGTINRRIRGQMTRKSRGLHGKDDRTEGTPGQMVDRTEGPPGQMAERTEGAPGQMTEQKEYQDI